MFGPERSKAWKDLPEPKMSWEVFKRMLPVFDNDPEKARQAWVENSFRQVLVNKRHSISGSLFYPSTMTDREKFEAWIKACPVSVVEQRRFQNGYMEVHVSLQDENDDDRMASPGARKYKVIMGVGDD